MRSTQIVFDRTSTGCDAVSNGKRCNVLCTLINALEGLFFRRVEPEVFSKTLNERILKKESRERKYLSRFVFPSPRGYKLFYVLLFLTETKIIIVLLLQYFWLFFVVIIYSNSDNKFVDYQGLLPNEDLRLIKQQLKPLFSQLKKNNYNCNKNF